MGDDLVQAAGEVLDVVRGLPPKVQMVVALKAFGFSDAEVARRLGYADRSGVRKLLERHGVKGYVQQADQIRRVLLSVMFNRIALTALESIRPGELEMLPVMEKVRVAAIAIRAAESLGPKLQVEVTAARSLAEELMKGLPVVDVTSEVKIGDAGNKEGGDGDDIEADDRANGELEQDRVVVSAGDCDSGVGSFGPPASVDASGDAGADADVPCCRSVPRQDVHCESSGVGDGSNCQQK